MPSLPKRFAPLCLSVVSILYHHPHNCNLYNAEEIANTLNIKVGIVGNEAIDAVVDVTLLLREFANEGGGGEYILPYNIFGC